ncbi:hypothetical protein GCM10010873_27810 [Cypionkella aquatica]|uniref:Ankyrin repeat domain-containing protein n=1 Tax=Cypionkella aquatica TaxID=1756042 RepID=A0AA37U0Y8_9RHOB|nr:hypothetical protein GCM10010873_27810 [Cypionkella aquatica]
MRDLRARAAFFARLIWRIGGRAVAQIDRPSAVTKPAATSTTDFDAIIEALQSGELAVFAQLGPDFASSDDPQSGQPWLFYAVDLGNLASLKWFTAQNVALDGLDKDGRSVLQAAVERAAAVDEFDDTPEDPLPLITALLDAGAAINAASGQGLTPLHIAAALGLADVVQLLLARGADPSLRDEGFAQSTPRDFALQAGHQAVAALLERP